MQALFETHPLPWLLKASWQAGVLIVLVLAAQWALGRRLSPRWRYGLWLLVVARLALPWTLPSSFSLFNVFGLPQPSAAVAGVPADSEAFGAPVPPSSVTAPEGRSVAMPMAARAAAGLG